MTDTHFTDGRGPLMTFSVAFCSFCMLYVNGLQHKGARTGSPRHWLLPKCHLLLSRPSHRSPCWLSTGLAISGRRRLSRSSSHGRHPCLARPGVAAAPLAAQPGLLRSSLHACRHALRPLCSFTLSTQHCAHAVCRSKSLQQLGTHFSALRAQDAFVDAIDRASAAVTAPGDAQSRELRSLSNVRCVPAAGCPRPVFNGRPRENAGMSAPLLAFLPRTVAHGHTARACQCRL